MRVYYDQDCDINRIKDMKVAILCYRGSGIFQASREVVKVEGGLKGDGGSDGGTHMWEDTKRRCMTPLPGRDGGGGRNVVYNRHALARVNPASVYHKS